MSDNNLIEMKYIDLFNHLKEIENYSDEHIVIDANYEMRNFSFESKYRFLLPGGSGNSDDYEYIPDAPKDYEPDIIQRMLNKKDSEIVENIWFRYHVILPRSVKKAKGVILMFHGFNEKYWSKYLPWAYRLCEITGKAVLMFPIAFHMNRAPAAWSNSREMFSVSEQRKSRHPNVISSSLSNVAISTRLHNKPQRFIWSGLQTYYDVIDLVEYIKSGHHPCIAADATIDFCSYSIGTFLGEILIMTNKNGYFTDSRYATFCGGAVFNRFSPVSKFILDSEANVSLYSFVVEHLESHIKRDEILRHFLTAHDEGVNFRCMLNYSTLTSYRDEKFHRMSDRIYAVSLEKDEIIPPYEIINTLRGVHRDNPIRIDILDFPYPYKHEDPFPALPKVADEVDKQFNDVFGRIGEFLK
jgi:hypothetical protein